VWIVRQKSAELPNDEGPKDHDSRSVAKCVEQSYTNNSFTV